MKKRRDKYVYRYHEIVLLFQPPTLLGVVGLSFRSPMSLEKKSKIVETLVYTIGAGIIIMRIHKYHLDFRLPKNELNFTHYCLCLCFLRRS